MRALDTPAVSTTASTSPTPDPTLAPSGDTAGQHRAPVSPAGRRRRRGSARRYAAVVLVGLALGALVVVVSPTLLARFGPHLYAGTVLQGSDPAPTMEGLAYTSGEPVDLDALRGDVVLVFYGYTSCPDECPTIMASLARTVAGLSAEERARTQVMMVTVDNAHDDAATLERWVTAFDPSFRGVRGSDEATNRAASLYGIYYDADPSTDGTTVDHTTSLVAIDPDGVLRVVWPPNVSEGALAADVKALLNS